MDLSRSDPRIDAYIARSRPFAQPILTHIRALWTKHFPETQEATKWGSPSLLYKGKIVCSMAAFKEHATFGFWHGDAVEGAERKPGAMGSFGRLKSVDDLPTEAELAKMFATAKALIDAGVKPPHLDGRGKHPKPALEMTPQFQAALDTHTAAKSSFESFPPSAQREYLEWIIDAKRDETRDKRIAQAVEWLAEGKKRNWKYENC